MRLFILLSAIFLLVNGSVIVTPSGDPEQREAKRELDWWEKTVFYQIYPKSFKDSDGDGIGDLKGITEGLKHLKELGIGATWLSPIYKSPQYDSGYDISNFTEIDEIFGTMEDFDEMIKVAKSYDIKIIMDFVPNHGSTEGEWFIKSENREKGFEDFFVWADAKTDGQGNRVVPSNWVSVFRGSAWEWSEKRQQYYFHQFVKQQPDFNYRNEIVVEEMKNVLRFWLDRGVAGFRIDAVNHLFEVEPDENGIYPDEPLSGIPGQGPDDFGYVDHIYTLNLPETIEMVKQWRGVLDEYTAKDNFTRVMMTEVYTDLQGTMKYYGNSTHPGSHMPFNFGLIADLNINSTAKDFKNTIDRWLTYMPLGKSANWVIGNHDQPRVGTRYGAERIDAMNMLGLLLPGVGITYYGEEIGMVNFNISYEDTQDPQACNSENAWENYWKVSRDPSRTPMQWSKEANAGFSITENKTWLPVNDNYEELNLDLQKNMNKSHYQVYKKLIDLRSSEPIQKGKFYSLALSDDVFAFIRWLQGYEYYIVVMNMRDSVETVDLTVFEAVNGKLTVVVGNSEGGRDEGSLVDSSNLKLDTYESLVLMGRSSSAIITSSFLLLIVSIISTMFR